MQWRVEEGQYAEAVSVLDQALTSLPPPQLTLPPTVRGLAKTWVWLHHRALGDTAQESEMGQSFSSLLSSLGMRLSWEASVLFMEEVLSSCPPKGSR